jgi:hypothetical protein
LTAPPATCAIWNAFIVGETSLNDDQPAEIPLVSSKSSMKASACVFVSGSVPLPEQTPVGGGRLPLEEPLLLPLDEPELEPELDPLLLPEEAVPPEELPLPELPPPSSVAGGALPVEHAPLSHKLAARKEMNPTVSVTLKLKCRMFFSCSGQRSHPTKVQRALRTRWSQ